MDPRVRRPTIVHLLFEKGYQINNLNLIKKLKARKISVDESKQQFLAMESTDDKFNC